MVSLFTCSARALEICFFKDGDKLDFDARILPANQSLFLSLKDKDRIYSSSLFNAKVFIFILLYQFVIQCKDNGFCERNGADIVKRYI